MEEITYNFCGARIIEFASPQILNKFHTRPQLIVFSNNGLCIILINAALQCRKKFI